MASEQDQLVADLDRVSLSNKSFIRIASFSALNPFLQFFHCVIALSHLSFRNSSPYLSRWGNYQSMNEPCHCGHLSLSDLEVIFFFFFFSSPSMVKMAAFLCEFSESKWKIRPVGSSCLSPKWTDFLKKLMKTVMAILTTMNLSHWSVAVLGFILHISNDQNFIFQRAFRFVFDQLCYHNEAVFFEYWVLGMNFHFPVFLRDKRGYPGTLEIRCAECVPFRKIDPNVFECLSHLSKLQYWVTDWMMYCFWQVTQDLLALLGIWTSTT